jgi:hypothetical protein
LFINEDFYGDRVSLIQTKVEEMML